jgi:zinc protease
VDNENTANALKEIFSELKKINEGITKKELEFAKSSLVKRFPSNFETYRQIASNIGSKVIHNLPDDYFKTYIQKINALSGDSINSIAQIAFNPDELISVLVGDKGKILNQLSKEDFGETESLDFDELFNHS